MANGMICGKLDLGSENDDRCVLDSPHPDEDHYFQPVIILGGDDE